MSVHSYVGSERTELIEVRVEQQSQEVGESREKGGWEEWIRVVKLWYCYQHSKLTIASTCAVHI